MPTAMLLSNRRRLSCAFLRIIRRPASLGKPLRMQAAKPKRVVSRRQSVAASSAAALMKH